MLSAFVLATCSGRSPNQTLQTEEQTNSTQSLPPTPTCDDNGLTLSLTAGPFYNCRTVLYPQFARAPISTSARNDWNPNDSNGQALSVSCAPIANALVDFWHANDRGEYDNNGYNLRGHQFTDTEGRYWLETIVPGIYPGRTRHFHVKVQAPNQSVLTTQLYFPAEPLNRSDRLFRPELLMSVLDRDQVKQAEFNFVLDTNHVSL